MSFYTAYSSSPQLDDNALVYIIEKDALIIKNVGEDVEPLPKYGEIGGEVERFDSIQYIGQLMDTPCYAVRIKDHFEEWVPPGFTKIALRRAAVHLSADQLAGALYALHINYWDRTTRFCGVCGQPTQMLPKERAKLCPVCGMINYPRISPAVIVAVTHDDRILLGRSGRFPQKLYSVIAGFVEPGETLEACVAREVKEETGISVTDIRYFDSQPWPYPDSLMIGFTARYAGGEIKVDGEEMVDAAWFSADNLPPIPDRVSISRQLIDWFVETVKKGK